MRSRKFESNREIVVIAHNIRSILNVGSILRSAEGFGIKRVFATGWTPTPDNGLPHVRLKLSASLNKTALGAEKLVDFQYKDDLDELLSDLKKGGFSIVGLEQDGRSVELSSYQAPRKVALILGEEVNGIAPSLRDKCDQLVEIPMFGKKESFNVSIAAGIAMYELSVKKII